MDRWGLNTIANWSDRGVYMHNRKAFTLQMRGIGIEGDLMGLVDVTDLPYPYLVKAVAETSARIYDIHMGAEYPVEEAPKRARGHMGIPDLWNQ